LQHERSTRLRGQAELRLHPLPEDLAGAVRSGDRNVRERLYDRIETLAGAPEQLSRVEAARSEQVGVIATLANVEADLLLLPEEHKVPVADAQEALAAADQACNEAQERRDVGRDEHMRLAEAHRTRSDLATKLAATRQRSHVARRLEMLLGRGSAAHRRDHGG
jgi:hypothetical protein